jgi:hypothetical protein
MPEQAWILITAVASSLVTALASIVARLPIEAWMLKVQHKSSYEWAAYQRLAEALAGPKGQALDAALELHRRIRNLEARLQHQQEAQATSWLDQPSRYYFSSFVYRVARLAAWVETVRRLLSLVDITIPQARREWEFVRHLQLVREAFISVRLFTGLPYDDSREQAHLFAGTWGAMASKMMWRQPNGTWEVIWEDDFQQEFVDSGAIAQEFESLVQLLQGLDRRGADELWRFKWARVKAAHYACALLLLEFVSHLQSDFRSRRDVENVLDALRLIGDEHFEKQVTTNLRGLVSEFVTREGHNANAGGKA